MLFNVFWGEAGKLVALKRFSNLLRRTKILKGAKDFYHCNQLLLLLVNAFWLALIATETGCQTLDKLFKYMKTENWHAVIKQITFAYLDPHAVHQIWNHTKKNVRCQAELDIKIVRAHHGRLMSANQDTQRPERYFPCQTYVSLVVLKP